MNNIIMDFEFDDENDNEETAKLDSQLANELFENLKYSNALDNLLHCAKFEKLYNEYFKKPVKNSMEFLMRQSSKEVVHAYSDKILESFGFNGYKEFIEAQLTYILLSDARKIMTRDSLSINEAMESSFSRNYEDSDFTAEIISALSEYAKSIGTGFVDYGMQLIEKRSENRPSRSDDAVRS